MRVWDIAPAELCDKHLVAEHAEIHAVSAVISQSKRGFASHPEVSRWRGKLPALSRRHDVVAAEMIGRSFRHSSPMPVSDADQPVTQDALLDSPEEQRRILAGKACGCAARLAGGMLENSGGRSV